ncbi:hypothetical protein DB44_AL00030 [Candidatus Protochlamydia amoebophila]|uniref:Uncharacterized protein n=1 Tax=Candidatus Protochlamydia amoebophila TaxID=362787 RepID=A0A0C1HAC5_9BACT|nr:hypothetical protein DB44_AL00030 [Candidatus Protochlamydia amoebophila]
MTWLSFNLTRIHVEIILLKTTIRINLKFEKLLFRFKQRMEEVSLLKFCSRAKTLNQPTN